MNWTDAQSAVLEATARLRVVRACPGSGKTQVFLEAWRRSLDVNTGHKGGVAALSFTNAAKDELLRRFGQSIPAPHFVGTLDAFLLRFVVRPFGHLVGLKPDGVRLIPDELTRHHTKPTVSVGPQPKDNVSAFEVHATGGTVEAPTFTCRARLRKGLVLTPDQSAQALIVKRRMWANSGRLTHSDCHFLAAELLRHPQFGERLVALLSERFPTILVDEFQDTGHFLGQALLALLASERVRGLVVGDPDQAIYEFSGANPRLFSDAEKLDGATCLTLPETHRCPPSVARVASALSASRADIRSVAGGGAGKALLLTHSLDTVVPDRALIGTLSNLAMPGKQLTILARKNKTLRELDQVPEQNEPGSCTVARKLAWAVTLLQRGQAQSAARQAAAVLGELAVGRPNPTSALLQEKGICLRSWRLAQFSLVVEAAKFSAHETWGDWLDRMKLTVARLLKELGVDVRKAGIGAKFRKVGAGWLEIRNNQSTLVAGVASNWPKGTVLRTIHEAKGAEYDFVVLFVPKPHKTHAPCPSLDWWSGSSEEIRTAFVAASRAKSVFVLCVHDDTYKSLRNLRLEFTQLFELITQGQVQLSLLAG